MVNVNKKFVFLNAAALILIVLNGCHTNSEPRLRISDFFGTPWGMKFPDPDDLGRHSLNNSHDEKLGMVYTCKAGFIDLGHLREAADRTHYLAGVTYNNIIHSKRYYSCRVIEPSRYYIRVTYPSNWYRLTDDQKDIMARRISILTGQYLAHTSLIWHEILTWYGFASSGVFSENISSFSCEDPYSDVLGTHLAVQALNDGQAPYEETMTRLIDQTLKELDAQPPHVAMDAAEKAKGRWYKGGYYFFVTMKKRNFDVGLDDGKVTPWLMPGICDNTEPQSCWAPTLNFLTEYGFRISVRIDPVVFQKGRIYKTLGLKHSNRIDPQVHFSKLIESIRSEAKQLEGNDVDTPPAYELVSKQTPPKTAGDCLECP